MLIPSDFLPRSRGIFGKENLEENLEHTVLTERLRKTLYYGVSPTQDDAPSLPVSEIAVGFLQNAAPRELGKVDMNFASNIGHEACIAPCSLMLGMVYVERLKQRNPEYLQQISSSDLFLISMMIASKYLYDEGVDEEVFNDEWAASADMDIEEMNTLECDFLKAIDWQLYVKGDDFFALLERIEQSIAYTQSRERGFHTYTDLLVLTLDGRLNSIFRIVLAEMTKVFVVCSVAYMAGIMTILGSTVTLVYIQQSIPAQLAMQKVEPVIHQVGLENSAQSHDMTVEESDNPKSGEEDKNRTESHPLSSQPLPKENLSLRDHTLKGSQLRSVGKDSYVEGTKIESDSSHKGFGLSGLLALSILKDTVVQFVVGFNERLKWNFSDKSSQQRETMAQAANSGIVCTCGCCEGPTNLDRRCVNVSLTNGQFHGHEFQYLHPSHDLLTAIGKHESGNKLKDCDEFEGHRRCCCKPRAEHLTWKQGYIEDSVFITPFTYILPGLGTTTEPVLAR